MTIQANDPPPVSDTPGSRHTTLMRLAEAALRNPGVWFSDTVGHKNGRGNFYSLKRVRATGGSDRWEADSRWSPDDDTWRLHVCYLGHDPILTR